VTTRNIARLRLTVNHNNRIDSGLKDFAINVFVSKNNNARNLGNDSRYLDKYRQISLEQWGNSEFSSETLAHEVGHRLRHASGAWQGMTGIQVPLDPLGNKSADSSNFSEDSIIDNANAKLRANKVVGVDDDMENFAELSNTYVPGYGGTIRNEYIKNNAYNEYRKGASNILPQNVPTNIARK
jgi:hypothetical protein